MRATARVVAVADDDGSTRLATLRGEAPLLPRLTGPGRAGEPAQVHLVGGAAGPLGGDELALELVVEQGASLVLRTVAACLALPGTAGTRSRMRVHATVGAGATLRWLPEPLIAAAGCDHETSTVVELAAGARLCWREELVCGRHGESPGALRIESIVELDGRTLLHQELAVGARAPGWDGPAALDRGRATATLILVDPDWAVTGPPAAPTSLAVPPSATASGAIGASVAWLPLAGPGVLVSAVAADPLTARTGLHAAATGYLRA